MKKILSSYRWVINHPNNKNKPISTVLRLAFWKLNQLILKIPIVVEMGWGIKFKCHPGSSWGSLVVYTRLPEYYEMKFVKKIIRNQDVVIDVGSNLGSYALIAASSIGEGHVYALEPSRRVYKDLVVNIKLNGFEKNISTFNIAAADGQALVGFTDSPRPELSHVSYNIKGGNRKVKATSLDKFVDFHAVKKIRLLKIDVEGYEYKVLKGASGILRRGAVDYLLIELNQDSRFYKASPTKSLDLLKGFGYEIYYFRNGPNLIHLSHFIPGSKTNNIVAIRKNLLIR